MKILLKKEVYEFREQCTGPTGKTKKHRFMFPKKKLKHRWVCFSCTQTKLGLMILFTHLKIILLRCF